MIIELRDVGYTIGKRPLFRDVSVRFGDAGTYALTGSSGCGKTTLLNSLACCCGPLRDQYLWMVRNLETGMTGNVDVFGRMKRRSFIKIMESFQAKACCITSLCHTMTEQRPSVNYREDCVKSSVKWVSSNLSVKKLTYCRVVKSNASASPARFRREPNRSLLTSPQPHLTTPTDRQLVMNLLFSCAENGAIVTLATHDESLSMQCDKIFNVEKHNANRQRLDVERYLSTLRNSQQ